MDLKKSLNFFYTKYIKNIRFFSLVVGIGLSLLVCVGIISLWYEAKITGDILIAQHVQSLIKIFHKINKTCVILDFDHPRTYIDFLNVNSFEGSEVGAMNLAHPERWQGAYLNDNLTMQGRVYEIVKIKQGFFIVPGRGVHLANGLEMGRDIIINENTDLISMTKPGGVLAFQDKALAAKMQFLDPRNQYNVESRVQGK